MTTRRHIPPYDFQYRFKVGRDFALRTVIDFYDARFNFKPREYWTELMARGEITVNGEAVVPEHVLRQDDILHTWRRDVTEPPVNDDIDVLYDKDGLFILNKKAPVPVHPSGRYFYNTLTTILRERFPGRDFHTIHRLDLWTTGVLLLATDRRMAKILHGQVDKRRMKKFYGVLAVGNFGEEPFTISVPVGRVRGAFRGFGENIYEARECTTRFTPLLRTSSPMHNLQRTTFLKAEPVTGRTNQIRVHVQAAGGHVLNDPLYSPHAPQEGEIPFLGLHCRQMDFILSKDEPFSAVAEWPAGFLDYFTKEELDRCFTTSPNSPDTWP